MAASERQFLLIDDNRDRRSLIVRTIRRSFPSSVVHECTEAEGAVSAVREGTVDAVLLHRASDVDSPALLRQIRNADSLVPVVYLAVGEQGRGAAASAGARFLNYDAWLTIGKVLEDVLAAGPAKSVVAPA